MVAVLLLFSYAARGQEQTDLYHMEERLCKCFITKTVTKIPIWLLSVNVIPQGVERTSFGAGFEEKATTEHSIRGIALNHTTGGLEDGYHLEFILGYAQGSLVASETPKSWLKGMKPADLPQFGDIRVYSFEVWHRYGLPLGWDRLWVYGGVTWPYLRYTTGDSYKKFEPGIAAKAGGQLYPFRSLSVRAAYGWQGSSSLWWGDAFTQTSRTYLEVGITWLIIWRKTHYNIHL